MASEKSSVVELDFSGTVNYWANRWAENRIGWHRDQININLQNFVKTLEDGKPKRFFIPLCGKTLDIPYLYELGHEIFGVEAVPQAIEELSSENSLGLKFDTKKSVYSSEDERIRIYCGDIFTCPFQDFGPFDCVWDRGSFIAFEYHFRPSYKQMMQRSLQVRTNKEAAGTGKSYHTFQYLLETLSYNRDVFDGPPRAVDEEDIKTYFGDWTDFQVVSVKPEAEGPLTRTPNVGPVNQVVYLFTPKSI